MATISTINETDLLSASRTTINSNFSALNTDVGTKITSPDTTSAGGKYLRRNSGNTAWELATISADGVTGASGLTNVGRLVKVSASGAISESSLVEASGRILLGAADNGTDKLQVSGTISATTLKGDLDWSCVKNAPAFVTETYSPTIPTWSGSKKDKVYHSDPIAGGHVGWICLGGTTWKVFGVIAL
ncbi:MAG: hypothetical protein J0H49_10630 [Acidobacteria bacterium]|nr:hypothetical protein [Acidobacteriota bacterium]